MLVDAPIQTFLIDCHPFDRSSNINSSSFIILTMTISRQINIHYAKKNKHKIVKSRSTVEPEGYLS